MRKLIKVGSSENAMPNMTMGAENTIYYTQVLKKFIRIHLAIFPLIHLRCFNKKVVRQQQPADTQLKLEWIKTQDQPSKAYTSHSRPFLAAEAHGSAGRGTV